MKNGILQEETSTGLVQRPLRALYMHNAEAAASNRQGAQDDVTQCGAN